MPPTPDPLRQYLSDSGLLDRLVGYAAELAKARISPQRRRAIARELTTDAERMRGLAGG